MYMLLHLHGCMKLTKQLLVFLHLPLDVCIQDASKQRSLLRGHSCLQNIQAIHQHHTRHVAINISLHYLCMFKHSGSASSNANSTLRSSHRSWPSLLLNHYHLSDHILLERQAHVTQAVLQKAFNKMHKTNFNTG